MALSDAPALVESVAPLSCYAVIAHRSPLRCLVVVLAGLTLAVAGGSAASAEEPWSVSERHPVLAPPAPAVSATTGSAGAPGGPPAVAPGPSDPVSVVFLGLLWVYQNVVSPVDGPTCGFYPTCGGYGRLAVHKHGWLLGGAMAMERSMRNHAAEGLYPLVVKHGVVRLHDPVEDNDFWFSAAPLPPPSPQARP